jgi:hypothetical protein
MGSHAGGSLLMKKKVPTPTGNKAALDRYRRKKSLNSWVNLVNAALHKCCMEQMERLGYQPCSPIASIIIKKYFWSIHKDGGISKRGMRTAIQHYMENLGNTDGLA